MPEADGYTGVFDADGKTNVSSGDTEGETDGVTELNTKVSSGDMEGVGDVVGELKTRVSSGEADGDDDGVAVAETAGGGQIKVDKHVFCPDQTSVNACEPILYTQSSIKSLPGGFEQGYTCIFPVTRSCCTQYVGYAYNKKIIIIIRRKRRRRRKIE